jgi:HEAT repeat protein
MISNENNNNDKRIKFFLIFLIILISAIIIFLCLFAGKHKTYLNFWIYTFDLVPFLFSWGIIITLWAISSAFLTVFYRKFHLQSLIIPIIIVILPIAYYFEPRAGITLFIILPIWLFAGFAVLLVRKIRGKLEKGFDSSRYWLSLIATIALLSLAVIIQVVFQIPDVLVSQVGKRSPVIETRLTEIGSSAIPSLTRGLASSDPRTSAACARILRHVDGNIQQPPLIQVLSRTDALGEESPRAEAAATLGKKGDKEAVMPLLLTSFENLQFAFKQGKEKLKFDKRFHREAIKAINEIENRFGDYRSADAAYKHIREESDPFKAAAWGLIGVELGGVNSLDSLETIFDKTFKDARLMILDSLEDNSDPACWNLLFRGLKDSSVKVRRRAISILEKRGELIVEYMLILMLQDKDEAVRTDANQALINISGENFGFDSKKPSRDRKNAYYKWLGWWKNKARE